MAKERERMAQRVGTRLSAARQQRGLSQEAVARRLNTGVRSYQRWENGEVLPRPDALQRIATYLKVEPEELLASNNHVPSGPAPDVLTRLDELQTVTERVEQLVREVQDALRKAAELERKTRGTKPKRPPKGIPPEGA